MLSQLWDHLDHFHGYQRFKDDVASGDLQRRSFIEPRYGVIVEKNALPNDQHPPHDVTLGEQLIADVTTTRCAPSSALDEDAADRALGRAGRLL